jgi:hypothetical protein
VRRLLVFLAFAGLAALPAVAGLTGNQSFSQGVPVRVPQQARTTPAAAQAQPPVPAESPAVRPGPMPAEGSPRPSAAGAGRTGDDGKAQLESRADSGQPGRKDNGAADRRGRETTQQVHADPTAGPSGGPEPGDDRQRRGRSPSAGSGSGSSSDSGSGSPGGGSGDRSGSR